MTPEQLNKHPSVKPYLQLLATGKLVVGNGKRDSCNWAYENGEIGFISDNTAGQYNDLECFNQSGGPMDCHWLEVDGQINGLPGCL